MRLAVASTLATLATGCEGSDGGLHVTVDTQRATGAFRLEAVATEDGVFGRTETLGLSFVGVRLDDDAARGLFPLQINLRNNSWPGAAGDVRAMLGA